jgi:hypothetical protein
MSFRRFPFSLHPEKIVGHEISLRRRQVTAMQVLAVIILVYEQFAARAEELAA